MNEIKIEKGIPIPGISSSLSGALKSMEVGDSIEMPEGYRISNMRSFAHAVGLKMGRKYSWRGRRVWRIA